MRVLLISPRFPWPSYTGDRLRAAIWLQSLVPQDEVALVAPAGDVPPAFSSLRFHPAHRSVSRGLRAGLTVLQEGLPLQSLLAAPYDWEGAITAARRDLGSFEATVVLLSRTDPWVRGSLNGGLHVLDAVDSLRRNAEERGNAASAPARWLWRIEERRLARAEPGAAGAYDKVVVVSGEETKELSKAAHAISNGVEVAPLDAEAPRTFDFGFWGRFPYFANADAVQWLLDEIWPAIRAVRPAATLAIAGAEAPRAVRRAAERAGITLFSPVERMPAFARSVRIALIPMRYGSGQSNKVLEAAEAGCAIIATPQAVRGLDPLAAQSSLASDTASFAAAAASLLGDRERIRTMAAVLRRVVESEYSRESTLRRLRALIGASA
jgi:glycosyltransferase involved in cell wall biosynthesis